MLLTDQVIRDVIGEVLAQMKIGAQLAPVAPGRAASRYGQFEDVDAAVQAATDAQKEFARRPLEDREKAVKCIRRICIEQAEPLGKEEFVETKIGRLDHKIEKLIVAGERTPGVEFLKTDSFSGGNGVTLTEYAPFGVIGAVTPVTHSLPTLAANAINMLAAGNAVVINPHPSGVKVACHGVELFNQAIREAIGIDNLICVMRNPTLESAQAIFDHRGISLLVVTGGPAVARAALRSPKRAIVAGPGNPPVVVDETACLKNAARSIIKGAAYDNNLLCISEKEVFAVTAIFDDLMSAMEANGAVRLSASQIDQLTKVAFTKGEQGKLLLNKDLIGQDPLILAEAAGIKLPRKTELLFGETTEDSPFVDHEQMMPFVPFVRVPDVKEAIRLAKKYEHGFGHTALMHSRNLDNITRMGREMNVSIFVVNGACMAGLGIGGEGYPSYSIATPTGEGITTPLTFTRQRRLSMIGSLRVA
jgi:aldehyde dehydrogenase